MCRVTLELNCWMHDELKDYLLSLEGIKKVEVDSEENVFISVEYDEEIIDTKVLKYEIFTFLDVMRIPSLLSFDKHPKDKIKEHTFVIKHLCCEFCYSSFIDDLFMTDGIESASANKNDVDNRENVPVVVTFNPRLVDEEKILKIEKEFNPL